mmetsp:Transcript_27951/g.92928  ORF Transcript_27951/g.92928 Transcript_27951/m.92928 type:complete len:534 (-) Transcript_27951:153-1754(-)
MFACTVLVCGAFSRKPLAVSTFHRAALAVAREAAASAPCLPRICCTRASSCSRVMRNAAAADGAAEGSSSHEEGLAAEREESRVRGGAMPLATSCAYEAEAESASCPPWPGRANRPRAESTAEEVAADHVAAAPAGRDGGSDAARLPPPLSASATDASGSGCAHCCAGASHAAGRDSAGGDPEGTACDMAKRSGGGAPPMLSGERTAGCDTTSTDERRSRSSCTSASMACLRRPSSIRSPPIRSSSRPHSLTLSSSAATAAAPPPERATSLATAASISAGSLSRSCATEQRSSPSSASTAFLSSRSLRSAVSSSCSRPIVSPAAAVSSSPAATRCRSASAESRFPSSASATSVSALKASSSCSTCRSTPPCSTSSACPSPISPSSSLRVAATDASSRVVFSSPPARSCLSASIAPLTVASISFARSTHRRSASCSPCASSSRSACACRPARLLRRSMSARVCSSSRVATVRASPESPEVRAAITDALGGGEGSIGTVAAGAGVRRSSAEAVDVMNEACSSGAVKAASATRGTL